MSLACAEGVEATVDGCVNTDPNHDIGAADTNDNERDGEKFFIKFPSKKQLDQSEVVICPGYVPSLVFQLAFGGTAFC